MIPLVDILLHCLMVFKERGTHELVWTPEVSISSGNYIIMMETPNDMYTQVK